MIWYSFGIDTDHFLQELDDYADALTLTRSEVDEIGLRAVDLILSRTNRGLDFQYKPFAPYSISYAKRRAKLGRGVRRVDLTWTGEMLANMQVIAVPSDGDQYDALVYFPNASTGQIAHYHNATPDEDPRPRTKIPLRRFIEIDDDGRDMAELNREALDILAER